MVLKDERDSGKNLHITFSDHAEGPYGTPPSASITPGGLWVKGPSMVKVGQEWVLYYDTYTIWAGNPRPTWEPGRIREVRYPSRAEPVTGLFLR
jgi:hypothetical protein